ncbi:MAG: HDOD domain-containing protein, partial [Lentisphaerae bacterium]
RFEEAKARRKSTVSQAPQPVQPARGTGKASEPASLARRFSVSDLSQGEREQVNKIITEIRKRHNLPALDRNVIELSSMTSNVNSRVNDLVRIIQRDTGLTSNLLSTVNSSLYAPKYPIESVSSAVILLGFDKIKALTTRLNIFCQSHKTIRDVRLYRLLTSSYFAGTFTQNLSKCIGSNNPEEAFVAGLLYQMPKLILANTFPADYEYMEELTGEGKDVEEACKEAFGVPFSPLCQAIQDAWNLPPSVAIFSSRNNRRNPLLGEIVISSAELSDILFGIRKGGQAELTRVGKQIGKLVRDPTFDVNDFLVQTTTADETIRRFFKFTHKELEKMVDHAAKGVAVERMRQKEFIVDIEQPARIIPRKQRLRLEEFKRFIAQIIREHRDINRAISSAMETLSDCISNQHIFTTFLSADQGEIRGRFYRGTLDNLDPTSFVVYTDNSRAKILQAFQLKRTIRCSGSERNLQIPRELHRQLSPKAALFTPILVGGKAIGALVILRCDYSQRFTDSEVAMAEVVADGLTTIFEYYQAHKKQRGRSRSGHSGKK